jgi:hypothetical protein
MPTRESTYPRPSTPPQLKHWPPPSTSNWSMLVFASPTLTVPSTIQSIPVTPIVYHAGCKPFNHQTTSSQRERAPNRSRRWYSKMYRQMKFLQSHMRHFSLMFLANLQAEVPETDHVILDRCGWEHCWMGASVTINMLIPKWLQYTQAYHL